MKILPAFPLFALFFVLFCGCSKQSQSEVAAVQMSKPSGGASAVARPPNVVKRSDLDNWEGFFPRNSGEFDIILRQATFDAPSGTPALEMRASQPTRYGITPRTGALVVSSGQRYRLSAYIRGGTPQKEDDGVAERSTLLRATLAGNGREFRGGHYYVGAKGTLLAPTSARFGSVPNPLSWTKLEGVVEIPPGVNTLKFVILGWGTESIYIGDAKVEQVEANTPLTPLL